MTESPPPQKKISLKTFFILLVSWVTIVVSALIGSAVYNRYKAGNYAATAVPYLQQVVPEISTWDKGRIRALMSPEAMENVSEKDFHTLVTWFSRLGELKKMHEPEFEKTDTHMNEAGEQEQIVEYTVAADYANGEAEINLKLRDIDGKFDIYHFTFASETLKVK